MAAHNQHETTTRHQPGGTGMVNEVWIRVVKLLKKHFSRLLTKEDFRRAVKAKKELKTSYYTKWEHTIEHLTAFGKRLDDDQRALVRSDVTIADDDKLQFYLEEIYDSNRFDKQEMLTWERQPTATKTDFDLAKAHFEEIVNATDTYEQNAGGGTAGRNRYESATQMADIPDEIIKEYKLDQKVTTDGYIYTEIQKGMYGLPQSGSNSHDELEERLNKQGYLKSLLVPALWKHNTRRTQ